jgi:hypothetical protein
VAYNDLYKQQKGRCGICKNKQKGKSLAVDHNHETGQVRALLCQFCNTAIGLVRENPDIAIALAEYLRVHDHSLPSH